MPVLSYQVNSPGQGGVNPKITYIFTDDPVSVVEQTGYIDWLANPQGIYPGDVALVVTRETPTSTLGAGFYEFVRVGMGPHWDLVPQFSGNIVNSVTGTVNELIANPTFGDVVISIYPDPRLPGTGSVGLPKGTTAQQAGVIGSIRFNTQTSVFEGTLDGSTWVPFTTGSPSAVTTLTGTANQIVVSAPTGNVTISIDPDPILPGTAAVTLPSGTTAQRGAIAGSIRFNTQIGAIELTDNGTDWYTVLDTNSGVSTVTGTANRITISGTASNPIIDIASNYVGQTSINTLGTVTTGTWNASTITVPFGGTSKTSFTQYAPICGGTTSVGALQSADTGISTAGYVLTSNGSSTLPSFQAAPGAGSTLYIRVPMTGTDVISSSGIPFQILPAAGVGFCYIISSWAFEVGVATFSIGVGGMRMGLQTSAAYAGVAAACSGIFNMSSGQTLDIGIHNLGAQQPSYSTSSPRPTLNNGALYLSNSTGSITASPGAVAAVHLFYAIVATI